MGSHPCLKALQLDGFYLPLIFCHDESEEHSALINFPMYLKPVVELCLTDCAKCSAFYRATFDGTDE